MVKSASQTSVTRVILYHVKKAECFFDSLTWSHTVDEVVLYSVGGGCTVRVSISLRFLRYRFLLCTSLTGLLNSLVIRFCKFTRNAFPISFRRLIPSGYRQQHLCSGDRWMKPNCQLSFFNFGCITTTAL